MTREEAIKHIENIKPYVGKNIKDALDIAIKALEQEPYEKFKSAKDHICKLAGDYKCWDNRLTSDEALELCHILEQESILDKIRVEIEQVEINGHIRDVECFSAGINTALKVIDKYKGERG